MMIDKNKNKINILTFLLIEDNLINQLIIVRKLKKLGHKVDIANNGKEGVNMFQLKIYDIILMDIMMPVMDGLTATLKIREIEVNKKNTPIIAITANAFESDRNKCLSVGMNDYMTKPFSIEEFTEIIKNLGFEL